MLEQIAYEIRPIQRQRQQVYFIPNDLEKLSAGVLYSPDQIYDFSEFQFSMHETDDHITGAKLKLKGVPRSSESELKLDGYRAAMGDLYAQQLGIPRISPGNSGSSFSPPSAPSSGSSY